MVSFSKEEERKRFKKIRSALTQNDVKLMSLQVERYFLAINEYQDAGSILFYCSLNNEVMTRTLIENSLNEGKDVGLPKVSQNGGIETYLIKDLEQDLEEGAFGIQEPIKAQCMPKDKWDMVVVPGLGFDKRGGRLGWGVGTYDRYLKDVMSLKVGLGYGIQLVDRLNLESQDILLEMLITDKGVLDFRNKEK